MSIASLILAFLSPLAPKLNPKPTKRELEFEADLKRREFALELWRTSCNALWEENERLRGEIAELRHSRQRAWLQQQMAQIDYAVCNCTPGRAQIIAP